MPTSNAITARYVTTGWGITCSSPSLRCKNTPHDGSGHTIMSDQIWPWEASPPNRSWPSRPDLYFWSVLKMGGLPMNFVRKYPIHCFAPILLTDLRMNDLPQSDFQQVFPHPLNVIIGDFFSCPQGFQLSV